LIRPILKADEADIDKGRLIYKLREVIGTSSLTISGQAHRDRRAAIHRQLQEGLAGDYVEQIGATIRNWAVALSTQELVDAHAVTAPLALRVICAILFGPDALSRGDEAAIVEAVHLVEDDLAEEMFRALPHTPWAYLRKKRKLRWARQIMSAVVERTRKRATAASLLRAFETLGLQGEALRDEVLLMLLAGHHTTGTAAAWILYHLARDEALASKLAQEASQLSDTGGELTPASVRSASASRAYVQEILRLYPSTYWMSRELKRDQEVAGMRLKRGTSLIIAPWHLHRDPRHWDRPDTLDITRSFAGRAYMPFGLGPRACVGMGVALLELQLIAMEASLAFRLEVASEAPVGPPKPSVTLVPPPIALRIMPRPAKADAERRPVRHLDVA
jgi:cytochrome P450